MIKVYGSLGTRSLRVVWALEEAGADYEYVKVDVMRGEGRRPPYIDINPTGKVPTLVEDDFVLSESAAICAYVGDRFPSAGLTPPAGTRERAQYDKWCYYVIGELEQPLWTIAKHRFAIPEKWRVAAVIETATWEFHVAAKALDQQFGDGPYVLGARFTCADILIAHTLAWADQSRIAHDFPRLKEYAQRCLARPALARAVAREKSA